MKPELSHGEALAGTAGKRRQGLSKRLGGVRHGEADTPFTPIHRQQPPIKGGRSDHSAFI